LRLIFEPAGWAGPEREESAVPSLRRPAAAVLAAAALTLAGCSGGGEQAEQATTTSPATEAATSPAATEPTDGATGEPTGEPTDTATDSAVGELVEGFPTDVVALPPGAEVTVSSVVPVDGRREVSLAGSTTQTGEEVLAFYRESLTGQGFAEATTPVPEGVTGATFTRGDGAEVLTLAVVTAGGSQQFTIGGFIAGG